MISSRNQGTILLVLIIIFVGLVKLTQIGFAISDMGAVVMNFEQCVTVGNPIMESHPRQCHSAGRVFIEDVISVSDNLALVP